MAPAGEIDQQPAAARERQRAVVVVRGGGEIVAAAPIVRERGPGREVRDADRSEAVGPDAPLAEHELRPGAQRSEEHTSELQSPCNLVCRLLLEKKNTRIHNS